MFRPLFLSAALVVSSAVHAAPGDITLEFMASPEGFTSGPSLGHAFFCIGLDLNSGIKEDCFGFYAKTSAGMFVGGPGVVNSEFQKNPGRFANVVSDFKTTISESQRKAIYQVISDFNAKNYSLIASSCIDLEMAIAQAAGLRAPPRSTIQLPRDFVDGIK